MTFAYTGQRVTQIKISHSIMLLVEGTDRQTERESFQMLLDNAELFP
jgi:hypothetical protein